MTLPQSEINHLLQSASSAQVVPFLELRINGKEPAAHNCFENTAMFAAAHPDFIQVYGWLCFDDRNKAEYVFEPHAVVQNTKDHRLIDVTPCMFQLPFIPTTLQSKEFEEEISELHIKNGNARLTFTR
jgi:hypothetical protein